jgi:hypothetical protein
MGGDVSTKDANEKGKGPPSLPYGCKNVLEERKSEVRDT